MPFEIPITVSCGMSISPSSSTGISLRSSWDNLLGELSVTVGSFSSISSISCGAWNTFEMF